jgi:tetratricopeptide (TPR) repeat protein
MHSEKREVTSTTRTINNSMRRRPKSGWLLFLVVSGAIIATLPFALYPFRVGNLGTNLKTALVSGKLTALGWLDKVARPVSEAGPSEKGSSKLGSVPGSDVRLFTQAVKALSKQIEAKPDDPNLQNRIGIVYAQLGEYTEAIQHLQTAISLARTRAAAKIETARMLDRKGDADGAVNAMLESSQSHVELSAAHSNLARVYDRLGMHDRVLAQLDQLNYDIALSPDFSRFRQPNQPLVPDQIAVRSVDLTNHRLNTAAALILARAQALVQARRVSEAMKEYRRLIRIDPQIAMAHQQLGLCAVMTNDGAEAITEFQTAVRLDPSDANSHNDLGLALLSHGDMQAAKLEFSKALSLQPKHLDAAVNLSNILASQGDAAEAEGILASAASANPKSAIAHNNLATVLSIEGKSKQAVSEFEVALSINPNLASAHYGLGLALMDLQAYPGAIREFKTSLALNPALIDAHNKIELAYRKSERASSSGSGIN